MSWNGITNDCKLTMWGPIINPDPSVKATIALKTKTALQTDLYVINSQRVGCLQQSEPYCSYGE